MTASSGSKQRFPPFLPNFLILPASLNAKGGSERRRTHVIAAHSVPERVGEAEYVRHRLCVEFLDGLRERESESATHKSPSIDGGAVREGKRRTHMAETGVLVVVAVPKVLVVFDLRLAFLLDEDEDDNVGDGLATPDTGVLGLLLPDDL
jgi:hypothetical protein